MMETMICETFREIREKKKNGSEKKGFNKQRINERKHERKKQQQGQIEKRKEVAIKKKEISKRQTLS